MIKLSKHKDINQAVLMKNMPYFFLIMLIFFIAITYFFGVFVEIYWVIFVIMGNYIFFISRKKELGSSQKYDDDLFSSTFTLAIWLMFALNFSSISYYRSDFNMPKENLYVVQGHVITDLIGNTSGDEILLKTKENKSMILSLNYLNNQLTNREVIIPVGENITVLYHKLYNGFYTDSDILIPYEITSDKYTYLHYEQSLNFFKKAKIKSILFLAISLILYIVSTYFAVRFVMKISRRALWVNQF